MTIQVSDVSRILSISLFGRFEARLDGMPLAGFDYNKVRALLAYLAVEYRQPHTRAALCTLLWPDLGENAARQNLSQALTRLRQVLGDKNAPVPFLLSTTDTVQLNPASAREVDVARFATLLSTAEHHVHRGWHLCTPCATMLHEAIQLYQGDFLAHFYLSDSEPFEEWALLLRQKLRSGMLSALERLMRYSEWRGNIALAVEAAFRQIELEPFQDHAHRETMRLLALSGQQTAATRHFDQLCEMLESELNAEPEAETIALNEQIRADPTHETLRRMVPPLFQVPAAPTAIVGREQDVQAICDRITGARHTTPSRLITITGAPGTGKTRLALEIAHRLHFDFEDGIQWIELAPLRDAVNVPGAIANALGVTEQPRLTIENVVADYLAPRHCLLVLDNFEHLLDAAPFVAMLLRACPTLSLLITSRAPLHLRAEMQFTLESLELPDCAATAVAAAATGAVQLFVQRAAAIHPTWQLNEHNLPEVAALCRRMDGLPLAIELVAPRLKSLSVAEILQEFESPLNAAPPGPRDMPARHRTLRNAIQWSYERLTREEQELFIHLGLFPGGCTAGSAGAVADKSGAVLACLESLHDSSLLYTRTEGSTTRYYQLETVREFARERLVEEGYAASAGKRFIDFFVTLADEAYVQLLGMHQATWSARIAAEQDNLRAALRLATDSHRSEAGLRVATGTWRFWWQRGNVREALSWLEAGLAHPDQAPAIVRTRALRAAGVLAMGLNDYPRARQYLENALVVALEADALYDQGGARTNLGMVLREQGQFEAACACLEQSAALMRTMEDPRAVKFPLIILASLYVRMGKIDQAARLYEECLRLNRDLGDTEGTANALYGIGSIHHARGEYARARQWCEQGLALYQSLNHQFGLGWCYSVLGDISRDSGDGIRALAEYGQSLTLWMRRGDSVNGAHILESIAGVWIRLEDAHRAARLLGAADAVYQQSDVRMTDHEHSRHDFLLEQCRAALGNRPFAASWEDGHLLSLQEAVALATG